MKDCLKSGTVPVVLLALAALAGPTAAQNANPWSPAGSGQPQYAPQPAQPIPAPSAPPSTYAPADLDQRLSGRTVAAPEPTVPVARSAPEQPTVTQSVPGAGIPTVIPGPSMYGGQPLVGGYGYPQIPMYGVPPVTMAPNPYAGSYAYGTYPYGTSAYGYPGGSSVRPYGVPRTGNGAPYATTDHVYPGGSGNLPYGQDTYTNPYMMNSWSNGNSWSPGGNGWPLGGGMPFGF